MKKIYLLLTISLLFFNLFIKAQSSDELWTPTTELSKKESNKIKSDAEPSEFKLFNLNLELLKSKLNTSPKRSVKSKKSGVIITFPNELGKLKEFEVFETISMDNSLQNKFSNIKTYLGISSENKNISIRFSISKIGLKATIFQDNNSPIIIEKFSSSKSTYNVYLQSKNKFNQVNCSVDDIFLEENLKSDNKKEISRKENSNINLRTFKIALATTGELSQQILNQNNTDSNATSDEKKEIIISELIDKINTINAVFERDLAIRFVMIEKVWDLIFLDPESDPFSVENNFVLIEEIQPIMDSILNYNEYDLGHLLGTNSCGGLALPSSLCSASKAKGVSSFWGSTFIHEIGHQLGAYHTFNNCDGSWAESNSGVEVGCGKTYMSYGDSQKTHFHLASIKQIQTYLNQVDCGTFLESENSSSPVIDNIEKFNIPISTPFLLDAKVFDSDGDNLTFSWEQLDYEPAQFPLISTSISGPSFEWKLPSFSSKRYFPNISTLVAGEISNSSEMLPSVNRTMNFGLLVRDNNSSAGSVSYKETTITFNENSGPFRLTSQEEDNVWESGTEQLITWDVANTDIAPINCSTVNILLSVDGGFSFTEILASEVENDGEQSIIVPEVSTAGARVKVESVENIFFSLNKGFISINPPNDLTFIPDDNFEFYLIEKGFDDTLDNYVKTSIIQDIYSLELSNRGINTLKGIEDFKNIQTLTCINNNLLKLDLSKNEKLKYIACDNNNLTQLNVSQNPNIWYLSFSNNSVSSIDISNNSKLQTLVCSNNNLNYLNVSLNSQLKTVNFSNNQITDLDTENNLNLTYLNCSDNGINTLNVSNNKLLKTLICSNNNLTELDVTQNIDLESIDCFVNELSVLDTSQCPNLLDLYCYFNQISELNLNQNKELRQLHCSVNNISSLDLSQNLKLNYLSCNSNNLSELNLTNKNELTRVNTVFNPDLFCIQVSDEIAATDKQGVYLYWVKEDYVIYSEDCSNTDFDNDGVLNHLDNCPDTPEGVSVSDTGCPNDRITLIPDPNFEQALIDLGIDSDGILNNSVFTSEIENITGLTVSNKNIKDLTGIEDFTNLIGLTCTGNQLTTLNLKFNAKIKYLTCNNNQLNELDLSNNLELEYLVASSNYLTNLDVSKNIELNTISCSNNKLTNLNVIQNTNLQGLYCDFNQIESLDLSNNIKLSQLTCNSNKLKELDISSSNLIFVLKCSDNEITHLNLGSNLKLYEFYCAKNNLTKLDLTPYKVLNYIDCSNNYLISLDVSSNTLLETLITNNNSNLSCIQVNQQQISDIPIEWIKDSETQYSKNCPILLDDDFDGVVNEDDICPETPIGEDVNSIGCSESQLDEDDDGIMNDMDQCLNTISGEIVDSRGCSTSQSTVKTFVPDDNFEQALIDLGYDNILDDYVNTWNIKNITELDINYKNIESLIGIEDFIGLENLRCYGNSLSELNISKNTKLKILLTSYNKLSVLDISKNIRLEELYAHGNNLTFIDLLNNLDLLNLQLNNNKLFSIDLSQNRKLRFVELQNTSLISLDVSKNIKLIRLYSNNNSIGCIKVNQNQLDGISNYWSKDENTEYLINCPEILDDDNDRIINENDLCPETPEGETVNENGCSQSQLDDDNDGVMNDKDLCPETPTEETVNENGCSQSQLDDDNDGVMNDKDVCPETPEGETVNENGCSQSQLDDDNDGVMNDKDVCPETPTEETVNENGCSQSQLDDDNDGVMNDKDVCPETPEGETVDENGCSQSQLDDDNDGVMNDKDLCPQTPEGETVNENGCSQSQLDDDNDGVMNDKDVCPETPEGETVNENGCSQSQLDDDNDGVMNDKDVCPETPEGEIVNSDGCILLASNNFKIETINETCLNKNNGQIKIETVESYNYLAIINGSEYSFTNSLTIENLKPDTYTICLVVPNVTSNQCYTFEIAEGEVISGKSSLTNNKISIKIDKGTAPFDVFVNGKLVYKTMSSTFDLNSKHGDLIEVKTAIGCEGVFSKTINLFEDITVYPNPTKGIFEIALPLSLKEVKIELFTINSQFISGNIYQVNKGKVQLDIKDKPVAMYIVKIHLENPVFVKIIKE